MAIKWIYGDWLTGATAENKTLDVLRGGSTSQNINAEDVADLRISKDKVPAKDWTEVIKVDSTMVALIDDSKNWNDPGAVLFMGKVNKADGQLRDAVRFQVSGFLEHLKAVGFLRSISGTITNPNEGEKFQAGTSQGLFTGVINHAISRLPMQPRLIANVDGNTTGSGWQAVTLYSSNATVGGFLENLRNATEWITKYNEFRFVPRWANSSKTRIVYDAKIGSDAQPQLNADKTKTIELDDAAYKILNLGLSYTSETQANRIIAQSKAGDTEKGTGADLTVLTVDNGKPLHDYFYSPTVELDDATLKANMQTILNDLVKPKGEASYAYIGSKAEGLALLGSNIKFVGKAGTDSEGYSVTVRVTAVKFSAESNEIDLDISLPQARYPRLPSGRKRSEISQNKPSTGYGNNGNGLGSSPGGGYLPGGMNGGGSLPPNTKPPTYTPPDEVIPGATPRDEFNKYKIGSGYFHTIAINAENKLYGWGNNGRGQQGNPDNFGIEWGWPEPQQLGNDTDWKYCWATEQASFATKENGDLYGWGSLFNQGGGEIGIGTGSAHELKPTKIMENVRWVNVNSNDVVFALTEDNDLYVWGNGFYGGIPNGENGDIVVPKPWKIPGKWSAVYGYEPMTSLNNAQNSKGWLAMQTDGSIWHWGKTVSGGDNGGTPTTVIHREPVRVSGDHNFTHVAWTSPLSAIATTENGDAYTWGRYNHQGKDIGDSTRYETWDTFQKSPLIDNVDYFPASTLAINVLNFSLTNNNPSGSLIHVIKRDGTLWSWGTTLGESGNSGNQPNGTQKPNQVGEDNDWGDAFWRRGYQCVYVIKKDGTLWVWGANSVKYGNLGNNFASTNQPTKIGESKNWVRVSPSANYSTIAVRNDDVWVAGNNDYCQLGVGWDAPNHKYREPVPVWTKQEDVI